MKSARFDTSKFYNSHLRQPKGTGYWIFECQGKRYETYGRYGDAKKAAYGRFTEMFPDQFLTIYPQP